MKFLIGPKVESENKFLGNLDKKRKNFVCDPLCLSVCDIQGGMKDLNVSKQSRLGCCPQGGRMPE